MKNIRLKVSDETYRRLSQEAKAAGFPGIASYILSKTDVVKFDGDAQREATMLNHMAVHKALTMEGSKVFVMKDLFTQEEWKSFTKSARIRASVLFLQEVEIGELKGKLLVGDKTNANHQQYIRVENV